LGRFETTVEFYRHREPYPPEFFSVIAARLNLTQQTRQLDVGCGPGNLALGFAPFVDSCTAIDREPEMRAAQTAAREAGCDIHFVQGRIEDSAFQPQSSTCSPSAAPCTG
jgi:2-polyprenyl-3-methyl-5-hydroxy-6-metoxy-1,4-benzoquinol methylase